MAARGGSSLTANRAAFERLMALAAARESELPKLSIEATTLSVYSSAEIRQMSVCECFHPDDSTTLGSLSDPRMGPTDSSRACATCHKDMIECPGHYGRIEFKEPMYHPLFMRILLQVLKITCTSCGRLRITKEQIEESRISRYTGIRRLKMLEAMADKMKATCSRDSSVAGGPVEVCQTNPKFDILQSVQVGQVFYTITTGHGKNKTVDTHIMPIREVQEILNSISNEDAEMMGFSNNSHPRNLIMEMMVVMPPNARPAVFFNGERRADPLTKTYMDIIRLNNQLKDVKLSEEQRKTTFSKLRVAVSKFIDNTDNNDPYVVDMSRRVVSIKERLQGKEAMIRKMMMGKRVDYSARTVLGPDPSLKFGQIRIPKAWAPVLTKPEVVNNFNYQWLTKLLKDGKLTHITPGPNSSLKAFVGRRIDLNIRKNVVLAVGDKVERWLQNGDYVIFNRQPTLHRYSMMGYEVVLGDPNTIGLHLSYTTPHNADRILMEISSEL